MDNAVQDFFSNLAAKHPELDGALNPPATNKDIYLLEKTIGIALPEEFLSVLRIANGQDEKFPGVFNDHIFLATEEIISVWKVWKGLLDDNDFIDMKSIPNDGIKNEWWSLRWVPFTSNGSGDSFCLDLSPADSGIVGQIIFVWHDMPERELKAKNLSEWIIDLG